MCVSVSQPSPPHPHPHLIPCPFLFQVVDEAISSGIDGYDADMKKAVQAAVKGLRLPPHAAIQIASKAVRD